MVFHTNSGIHIGASGEGVYRFSVKVGEKLLIPATSWKGAFRALSERIIDSMKPDGLYATLRKLYCEDRDGVRFKIDDSVAEESKELRDFITSNYMKIINELKQLAEGNDEVVEELEKLKHKTVEDLLKNRVGKSLLQRYLSMLYPITSLYGSQGVAGKIRFLDTLAKARLIYRPGVGINRMAMTADEGKLYFTEVLLPEEEIGLRLVIDNVSKGSLEAKIFATTLKYIKAEGLQIGGSKSRGIGHIELEEEKTHFRVLDLSEDVDLATKIKYIASPKNGRPLKFDDFVAFLEQPRAKNAVEI